MLSVPWHGPTIEVFCRAQSEGLVSSPVAESPHPTSVCFQVAPAVLPPLKNHQFLA